MGRRSKPHRRADGRWQTQYHGRYVYGRTAEDCARKLARAKAAAGDRPAGQPVTLAEAIERYRLDHDSPTARQRTDDLIAYGGNVGLYQITDGLLLAYLRNMRKRALGAWTIRGNLTYAKSVLRFCHASGWIDRLPTDPYAQRGRVPRPIRNPRSLDPDDLAAVMAALGKGRSRRHACRAVRFLLATGARPGEVCRLRWEHARRDRDGMILAFILPEHKAGGATGEPRVISVSAEARDLLPPAQRRGAVFTNRVGRPYTPTGLRSTVRRASQEALGQAIGPYRFRHTFAEMALDQLGLMGLREALGHRDVRTTMIYLTGHRASRAAVETLRVLPPPAPAVRARRRRARRARVSGRPGTADKAARPTRRTRASRPAG